MKYFIDTEFSERGPSYPIQLISIGIVAEDGRELYAVAVHDAEKCNEWVKQNVIPQLGDDVRVHLHVIANRILGFTSGDPKPEFWGYYSAYDWVVFAQIFGTMMGLPKNFPKYCRDIKQLCGSLGNPKLPEQGKGEHNALADARWNKTAYDFLVKYEGIKRRSDAAGGCPHGVVFGKFCSECETGAEA